MAPTRNNLQAVESDDEDDDEGNHSVGETPTPAQRRAPKPSHKQKEIGMNFSFARSVLMILSYIFFIQIKRILSQR